MAQIVKTEKFNNKNFELYKFQSDHNGIGIKKRLLTVLEVIRILITQLFVGFGLFGRRYPSLLNLPHSLEHSSH